MRPREQERCQELEERVRLVSHVEGSMLVAIASIGGLELVSRAVVSRG
jgi:hypothetical protein